MQDQLMQKATPSSATMASLNPNPDAKELPAHQSAPSTSLCGPSSTTVPNVSTKALQVRNPGKPVSASLPARASDKFIQGQGYSKGFNKNKVLVKSTNPGWHAPGGNANLVISFSDDDDSGSDGERKQKTARVSNRHPHVANIQRPPALPHVKPDTARRTANNVVKVATKKAALNRTFVSSMTKIHGSNVKGTGPLAQRRSWSKNSSATGRILPSQDGGFSKQMDLSSSKLQDLQDLRQQIAMRENELKLKKVQQNRENVSEPSRDIDVMDQTNKVSSKKSRTVPAGEHTDTEEPDMKRLKLSNNSSGQPSSRDHKDKSLVLTPLNISGHLHDVVKVGQPELLPRSCEMQIQKEKRLAPPSHNERSTLLQGAAGVGASCSLSDWVSRPLEASAIPEKTVPSIDAIFADHPDKSHTDLVNRNILSSSVPNHDMCISNMNEVNDCHDAVSAHEKNKSKSDNALQDHSLQVSDSKFESPNASPDNTSALHSLDRPTVSGRDVDSLFEMEDICDKELEEAQELRHRCEIEERNALKAYRRAQRALVEANSRCTHLYRQRELCSARLRSFLMEDSSLFLTSRQHGIGDTWNLSYNVCEANVDVLPMSSHQLQAEYEPDNHVGYGSNAQSADGDEHNRVSGNEDVNNLRSEACSDRDASISDVVIRGNFSAANGIRSPSNDPNFSPDDGETFPLDHRSLYDGEEGNTKGSNKDMNADTVRCFALGSTQDSLYHEACLRSTLLSRGLGMTGSSKKSNINSDSKSAVSRVAEENVAEDLGKPDRRISKTALNLENQQPLEERSLNNSRTLAFDSEEAILQSRKIASTPTISSSIFRSAIVMAACRSKLNDMQIIDLNDCSPSMHNDDDLLARQNEDKSSLKKERCPEDIVEAVSFGRLDSYTFKGEIDPFKPLCLYELRGRCNDSECPSQHLRGNSSRNVKGNDSSDDADCQPGSLPNCLKQRGSIESFGVLTPPEYLVSFDSLKAESHNHGSPFAHQIGASHKNCFSNSLAVSNALVKLLPSNEPFLHGNDGCVDYFVGSGQSLYFQSRNGAGNPLRKGDNEQTLEIALLSLNQAVNRFDGMKKALSELSRAVDSDPESFQLWIVYLPLLHSISNKVSSLKYLKDLFSKAVQHNPKSYELWLFFINSREKLNDRFAAYVRAISCLLHDASPNDEHSSAVILDLFLQMLYCFCISGNIAEAVQRIQGLILPDRDSDESHSLLLSDILKCLTIPDKCIFWVSCVYLMIYRKLPDALVQQFEFEKDISVIEWPSVRLTLEEKQQVFKLMEMAVDSIGLPVDSESSESDNQKSAYLIALNHIKLMAAIDGEGSCRMLLEKYKNVDPPCLQFILLSSRAHGNDDENTTFEGFEEALSNWPKDVPGSQCIWNQFAEYALETGQVDKAKEIMDQWFHSVWQPLCGDGSIDPENEDERTSLLNSLPSDSSKMDIVFGLLNLSLFRLFQNDILAAHIAIDEALRTADAELLRHCVREHAAFLFNYGSQLRKDVSLRGLIDILKGYMVHAQSIPTPRCLTTKFIQEFKRPRVRQLVSNLLCPSSPDPSLVNSVLDIWFGPSLLPQNTDELKDLVDFIESVIGLSPGNYQVAISACRLICERQDNSKFRSPSVLFWASSLLVNTIYQAFPVPPEFVWVEGTNLLGKLTVKQEIYESFLQRALSAYPFSIKLQKSFLNKAARDKGMEVKHDPAS